MTKIRMLLVAFLFLFGLIVARLFYLQVLHPTSTSEYLNTERILPQRGKIYDRNMQPLTTNQVKYRLFFEPKKINEPELAKIQIARALHADEASVGAKIDKTKDWVSVKGGLTEDEKTTIENLHLNGMGFDEEQTRFYPEGSSAAHLLGFVGKNDDGDSIGYFGIEGYYDKDLAGIPGLMRSDRDLIGRPIFLGTQERIDPENGRDLVLTIDKTVQKIVKDKLKAGMELYKAKEGCAIIANPFTMEILGLSCLPDFDEEEYFNFDENYYKNPAISSLYEPGSTFKPLVMAAGLEEKLIKPDSHFNEDGPVKIGDYSIRTWNNSYEGNITMTRILEKSSNVGMVYVGKLLGNDKLLSYVRSYGFGQMTDIDLQGEVPGYLKQKQDLYPIDYATITFGQGIVVSPIQMISAFSTLINGGNLMRPYVVSKLISPQNTKTIEPHVVRRIISSKTSDTIKQMLVSTIENGETKNLRPKGYAIGGKTGTAQIAIKGHYDASKTIASFIGFSPVDSPKFIGLIILKEPESSQWGSETAAPIFFEIAKELIVYYNIAPEQ